MNVEPMKIEVERVPDGQLSSRPLWSGPCPACAGDAPHRTHYSKLGFNSPKCWRIPANTILEIVEKSKKTSK